MSKLERVVSRQVNGIFVKRMMKEKGWTKQEAADLIVEFIVGGTKMNFNEFMKNGGEWHAK